MCPVEAHALAFLDDGFDNIGTLSQLTRRRLSAVVVNQSIQALLI